MTFKRAIDHSRTRQGRAPPEQVAAAGYLFAFATGLAAVAIVTLGRRHLGRWS
jgi:hypothetical protein